MVLEYAQAVELSFFPENNELVEDYNPLPLIALNFSSVANSMPSANLWARA